MTKSISNLLSDKRLDGYRGGTRNDLQMILHRYNYNIELSNEFYPFLSIFEVAFRNSLHLSWGKHFQDSNWICNYKKYSLAIIETSKIEDAIDELTNKRKPINGDGLIAELNLGFWVNLFDHRYLEINKKTIKDSFPNATNKQRDIFRIKSQLNDIRNLRNRIFHHEPIWNWNNLEDFLNNLKNFILWMDKDLLLPRVVKSEESLKVLIERQKLMLK
ncbi:MAG: Abi family protein [Bacteriovoracaceae bacterium]|nr:Abi family protein [Bacteriovoracaceae bacterium]